MKLVQRKTQWGMVLIEAMVALVVIATGGLGIAKLNSFFLEVSGQAKARTQAVQLAEGKLEQLRSLMVRSQFDAIIGGVCENVYGLSASDVQSTVFERCWTVTPDPINADDDRADILVTVSWTDRMNIEQAVEVGSIVAWDDPGKAVALVKPIENVGRYAQTPTGRAKLGDGTMPVDNSITPKDGLRQQQGDDRKWRLVDASGKVLLTATVEDEPFSEVAGNVYIDQANLSSLRNEDVYIVISDASFCAMTPVKNLVTPAAPLNFGDGSIFKTFSYRCYLGANWFGNIGVIRVDSANTNDRVCLGDPAVPAVAADVKSDNRHPALGTSRMYRGYVSAGTFFKSTGIGVQSSDTSNYTAAIYDGHDFLLTRITGNPTDADCSLKLARYAVQVLGLQPPLAESHYQPFSTDAQNHTGVSPLAPSDLNPTETAFLQGNVLTPVLGNPGRFFCFTTTCPDPLPNAAAPEITISITGTIARSPTAEQRPVIASISTNSGNCTFTTSGSSGSPYTYSCSFTGTGFTGSSWSGAITANTADGAYVCHTGTGGNVSPIPTIPTSPVQNSYSFEFTNQPVDAGDRYFDFKIGKTAGDC